MSTIVNVWVSSPDTHSERRFDLHTTIGQLKARLELITGIPVSSQSLTLHDSVDDKNGPGVSLNEDDERMLGAYGIRDWMLIKVADTNPGASFTGQLTDVSQVQKFEISDAEYARRPDTVLAYKQQNKVGRFADASTQPVHAAPTTAPTIPIGARCEVDSDEPGLHKRGTVRFVGLTKFAAGVWVGIEYDEPMGKNDGSVKGERYFECSMNYGVFVRPEKVKVGDYPVLDIDFDDEEM